jgi:hypothetical protein
MKKLSFSASGSLRPVLAGYPAVEYEPAGRLGAVLPPALESPAEVHYHDQHAGFHSGLVVTGRAIRVVFSGQVREPGGWIVGVGRGVMRGGRGAGRGAGYVVRYLSVSSVTLTLDRIGPLASVHFGT